MVGKVLVLEQPTTLHNALRYTVTLFGQSQEATAKPETDITKDGDNYKVTVKTTVNGQTTSVVLFVLPKGKINERRSLE